MNTLREWIGGALLELFSSDDNSLIERGLKEECINHRFAVNLEKSKPDIYYNFYIDLEYNKAGLTEKPIFVGNKILYIRPDIIVHRRLDDRFNNLVAIECKKNYLESHDKRKLLSLSGYGYNYSLCIGISYQPGKDYFILYEVLYDEIIKRQVLKSECNV